MMLKQDRPLLLAIITGHWLSLLGSFLGYHGLDLLDSRPAEPTPGKRLEPLYRYPAVRYPAHCICGWTAAL